MAKERGPFAIFEFYPQNSSRRPRLSQGMVELYLVFFFNCQRVGVRDSMGWRLCPRLALLDSPLAWLQLRFPHG